MTQTERPRVTVPALRQMKTRGERIAMVSAYDAAFARMFDEAGVDALLVGDTLGRARGRGRRHRVAALARHAVGHWAAHRGHRRLSALTAAYLSNQDTPRPYLGWLMRGVLDHHAARRTSAGVLRERRLSAEHHVDLLTENSLHGRRIPRDIRVSSALGRDIRAGSHQSS